MDAGVAVAEAGSGTSDVRRFLFQKPSLSVNAPVVAAELAVPAHDAVAGDDERNWIGRAGARDGPRRRRPADTARHFSVARGRASGNALQLAPHPSAGTPSREHRAASADRAPLARGSPRWWPPTPETSIGAIDTRIREFSSQVSFESAVARADLHCADAARRPGNEQPSERRRDDHVADGCALSAARVSRRSHPEHRRRLLVDAAARAIAGIIGGGRHAVPVSESGLERSDPAGVAVLTGRDSKQLLEGAKQMMRTGCRPAATGQPGSPTPRGWPRWRHTRGERGRRPPGATVVRRDGSAGRRGTRPLAPPPWWQKTTRRRAGAGGSDTSDGSTLSWTGPHRQRRRPNVHRGWRPHSKAEFRSPWRSRGTRCPRRRRLSGD